MHLVLKMAKAITDLNECDTLIYDFFKSYITFQKLELIANCTLYHFLINVNIVTCNYLLCNKFVTIGLTKWLDIEIHFFVLFIACIFIIFT
jgi:hypothetical protein